MKDHGEKMSYNEAYALATEYFQKAEKHHNNYHNALLNKEHELALEFYKLANDSRKKGKKCLLIADEIYMTYIKRGSLLSAALLLILILT